MEMCVNFKSVFKSDLDYVQFDIVIQLSSESLAQNNDVTQCKFCYCSLLNLYFYQFRLG